MVKKAVGNREHQVSKSERLDDALISAVRLREVLEADARLEASAFGIEARAAIRVLQQAGAELVPLCGPQGLCGVPDKPYRLRRVYVTPEHGIPFLSLLSGLL